MQSDDGSARRRAKATVTMAAARRTSRANRHEMPAGFPGNRLSGCALDQARIELGARAEIITAPMYTDRQVATALAITANDTTVSRLRMQSKIVGVPIRERHWYPQFQFEIERARIRPEVAAVNQLLVSVQDPWGVASWWLSPSSRIGEKISPSELVVSPDLLQRTRVIDLATALLEV